MPQVRIHRSLSILLVSLIAVTVLAAQPVQAGNSSRIFGRILNNQGSEYEAGFASEPEYGSYENPGGCAGDRYAEKESSSTDTAIRAETISSISASTATKLYEIPEGSRPLRASLSGAAEVPGPGDPDGSSTAFITLKQGQSLVCWAITAPDIVSPTAAHIHAGVAGIAGPVVVTLSPPEGGTSAGCASVDRALYMEIRKNPAAYYVNVHTAEFPSGALRGQLTK